MRSSFLLRSQSIVVALVLVLLLSGFANAQKIKVEFDKSLDFSKFKTYAFDTVSDSAKPMLRLAILAAVQSDLNKLGLTQVAEKPDLFVQMYGATDNDFTAHYHDPVYGGYIPSINSGINLWHNIPGTTTTVVIPKGTLVIDIVDASRKQLIWRGIAKAKLSDQRDKLLDQVNTAVEKMLAQYPAGQK